MRFITTKNQQKREAMEAIAQAAVELRQHAREELAVRIRKHIMEGLG